jgi:glycerol-3-phosphate O-acyltransferase
VDAALNVLGSMISRQKNVLEPVIMPAKRFELSYYRNQIVHLFVNEGMISCSLYRNMRGMYYR